MTEETTGQWIELIADHDYEIWNQYPFPIRRKGTDNVINEWINNTGYMACKLNGKQYRKHRIIALQFIPNNEPDDKPFIDHINHKRADNRIENLRWVSKSQNSRNKIKNRSIL